MAEGDVISEHYLGQQDQDSPEFRARTIPAIKDFVKRSEPTIGTTPEQRVAWLTDMQPHDISNFLIQLNGTARGIENHTFDGEGVRAGPVSGSIPPAQPDKEPVLHYVLA